MRFLASLLPNNTFIQNISTKVGDLDRPLGESEGAPIDIFTPYPIWIFYLIVGLVLIIGGLWHYSKNKDPMIAALIASSIIFGFAHFEDWRYVLFATFAGLGYGFTYFKTKNIVPAAAVHMGVDAVCTLILQYP